LKSRREPTSSEDSYRKGPMKLRHLLSSAVALAAVLGSWEASHGTGAPSGPAAPAKDPTAVTFAKDVIPFLTKHCHACHGNGKNRGDGALEKSRDDESVQKDRKLWESVLHMVRTGEMPPKDKPRPPAADIEAALKSLETVLANFDCTGPRNAGRVTLRRLNKAEYNNTIRDLIGVD